MCRNSYYQPNSPTRLRNAYRGESTGTSATRRDEMQIFRYADGGEARIGVIANDGRRWRLPVQSLAELLQLSLDDVRSFVEAGGESVGESRLLPPIDGRTEVWAAGVTYQRSSDARQEESVVADVYARVYDAVRPELFFKSAAWRVVGAAEPIGVRPDSDINVSEPELALVFNAAGESMGYTICNDVSSRSIEGENPLYLPQAKVYTGSCALGPTIRPAWEIADPYALAITVQVTRDGTAVWEGETSTSLLHRRFDDLVEHLYRNSDFPDGAVLSTGTGLVPDITFNLEPGDAVEVAIDGIGTLVNEVRPATYAHFGWLTPDPARNPRA
jgi:2-dehydro-3-deoxy-D-arabinonate dehydratase